MHFIKYLIISVALFIYLIGQLVTFLFEEISTCLKLINVNPVKCKKNVLEFNHFKYKHLITGSINRH